MSLGSGSNTYIRQLIETSADAMTNLYFLDFSGGILNKKYNNMPLALRVRSQDFNPPTFTQAKDTKNYMTVSVDMPNASFSGDKTLQFRFRLDSNYLVYEYLLEQQAITSSANLGWAINSVPDAENNGFNVSVYAYNKQLAKGIESAVDPTDETAYQKLYEFNHCWIKEISGLEYSYDNPSPMTISVTAGFFDFKDPMNLLMSEV